MTRWRLHVVLALVCAGVAAAMFVDGGAVRFAVPPVLALAVLVAAPVPAAGPVVVGAAMLLGAQLGASLENPGPLLTVVVTSYVAGRRAGALTGLLSIATLALAAWVADDRALATLLFIAVVVGGIWGFGRLVCHRAQEAERAGAEAARLAADDPEVVSARVVRIERERLAADTIGLIRQAVTDMRGSARSAAADLDPAGLAAVQARGAEAVADLRRLLGLLRSEPEVGLREPQTARTRRWPTAVEWGPTLAALLLLPLDLSFESQRAILPWAVVVAICLAPLVQRRQPAVAALAVGALPALALSFGVPLITGFSLLVAVAAVCWYAGSNTHRVLWVALAAWLAARIWVLADTDPGNIPMEVAIVCLPFFAGRAWHERDRAFRRARAEAERLLGAQETVIARAVAEERLRIARELHDVSSHAVGVMVLQAGAAVAQRLSDPDRARAALATIDEAAAQAIAELDTLARVLTSELQTLPASSVAGLAGELECLADRMRGAGLVIDLRLGELTGDDRVAGAVYRTVQEALTNAARHAPGSGVSVAVDRADGAVVVEVVDSGARPPHHGSEGYGSEGSGFGLEGLAERIRALGGELAAGPRPEGGFAVRATLPAEPRPDGGSAFPTTLPSSGVA